MLELTRNLSIERYFSVRGMCFFGGEGRVGHEMKIKTLRPNNFSETDSQMEALW
jgi:hypothetical protein